MARKKTLGKIEIDLNDGSVFVNGDRMTNEFSEHAIQIIYQTEALNRDRIRAKV